MQGYPSQAHKLTQRLGKSLGALEVQSLSLQEREGGEGRRPCCAAFQGWGFLEGAEPELPYLIALPKPTFSYMAR